MATTCILSSHRTDNPRYCVIHMAGDPPTEIWPDGDEVSWSQLPAGWTRVERLVQITEGPRPRLKAEDESVITPVSEIRLITIDPKPWLEG